MKRRWLRVVAWCWAGLLVACGLRLLALPLTNGAGVRAVESRTYAAAVAWFDRGAVANPVARWVAPYNRGVAHFGDRDWGVAADDFREALRLAPAGARCRVALNLAWTLEAQGDDLRANGDAEGARGPWAEAAQTLERAQCQRPQPPEPDSASEQQQDQQQQTQQAGQTAERLDRKQQEAAQPASRPAPHEQQRRELQQRQEQSQRSAQQGQDSRDQGPAQQAKPSW